MRSVLLAALAAIVSAQAAAVGHLADVSIIDRDTGQRLTAWYHDGEYWVAGRPGAHYAIQIHSRDGRRLLGVTSVDGVNVLTGETADYMQRGYVFEPGQGYDIAGWRKSEREIAAFTFTSIPKSYAVRTGRPQNVGVIGVALFRERQRPPKVLQPLPPAPPAPPSVTRSEAQGHSFGQGPEGEELEEVDVTGTRLHSADAAESAGKLARQAPAPSLGTGHGRREHSLITVVPFERASKQPDEVIRIRYDSRENLVALGVIARDPPRPKPLDPFPRSPRLGYVPDP